MTITDAINNLFFNYGQITGLEKQDFQKMIEDAMQINNWNIRQSYNAIRLAFGNEFNQQELFTCKEAAELLAMSEIDFLNEAEKAGAEIVKTCSRTYTILNNLIKLSDNFI